MTTEEMLPLYKEWNFKVRPMWHQLVSLTYTLGEDLNRVAYLHGVGTGKTIVGLLTTRIWECRKILVICPGSAFGAWEKDIEQATEYSYVFVEGTKEQRFTNLNKKKDIHIVQYETLKTIYAKLRNVGGDKRKWMVDHHSFTGDFDCVIFDEVHKCKNYSALQSEICFELTRRASYCIGLTGTPLDKTLLELFNIYKVIDLGDSLGTNFFAYRHNYFDRELKRATGGRLYAEWTIKPGAEKQILNRLSGHTISFDRQECFDLPESQTIERPVRPSSEFLDLQRKIIEGDTIEVGDSEIDCSSMALKSQKLLQLSSGFLYYGEDERKVYRLKENPKLDALIDFIEDSESKVIVVHRFTEEALLIEKALRRNKIEFVAVRGNLESDRKKDIQKFKEDKEVKVMLIHPVCASEGFDGSVANIVIFFSPIASPAVRKQCEGRVHRKSQNRKCVFFDLVTRKSVDSVVNQNRAARKGLVDSVMEYIQGYQSEKI